MTTDARLSPLAGKPLPANLLVDFPKLIAAYYTERPDPPPSLPSALRSVRPVIAASRSSAASTKRTCSRSPKRSASTASQQGIDGPLFMGFDTHALSAPAFASALEVLAANDVETSYREGRRIHAHARISHAILVYNRGRERGLADGIVITPSHNPPDGGGFKYNPPNGGPADTDVTRWIEQRANALIAST